MRWSFTAFFNILSDKLVYELDRPRRICKKIICYEPKITIVNNIDVHNNSVCKFVSKILHDNVHPLHNEYVFLPHGTRLRACLCRTNRFKNTCVPISMIHYNNCKICK